MRGGNLLRSLVCGGWVIGLTLVWSVVVAVCGVFDGRSGRLWIAPVRWWARHALWALGVTELEVVGGQRLAQRGVLVMANHQSHLDPPALFAAGPAPLTFLTKRALFFIPLFGAAMWAIGMIPVDRARRKAAFASLDLAGAQVVAGKRVIIFPEGTRACREGMGAFKRGGFLLAQRANVPIVPVGIAGTREVYPPGFRLGPRGPVVVVVGEPIDPAPYATAHKHALSERVREEIEALRAQAWARHRELAGR